MKMLVIIDIETKICDRDVVEIIESESIKPRVAAYSPAMHYGMNDTVNIETIAAEIYRYPNGTEVKIGMSRKVQKILGLPLEAVSNMSNTIYSLQKSNREITTALDIWQTKCEKYQAMTFWQRLKFLINKP
jgi:hypothetical protein